MISECGYSKCNDIDSGILCIFLSFFFLFFGVDISGLGLTGISIFETGGDLVIHFATWPSTA